MVKINLWSGWQEASATGWVWRCRRCRKAELCCLWKLKTPSQHLPPRRDRTDQDGQHETGMQTCSAGWDPAPWVPISMWWRKGTCAQVHRLQTRLVWLLKSVFLLKQNHLGHLTPHTFCLFRVYLLCSLQLSFPTRTLRTFLREAALRPQTCKASWQPRRKSTKRPIFCRMGLIWHCFCWLLNLLQ